MAGNFGVIGSSTMRWNIALAVGLPVVVGVGYWYLIRKNKSSNSIQNGKDGKTHDVSLHSDTPIKFVSKCTLKTPLEEAIAVKEEGNKCFKNGKYDEAIALYNKAIELCPKSEELHLATIYHNKSAVYQQLKNYEEVIKACNEALSLHPKYIKALSRRANAYEQTKELSLAFEDLTAVCILEKFESRSTIEAADAILNELVCHDAKEAIRKKVPTMPSRCFIKQYFSTFINDPIHSFFDKDNGDSSKGFLKAIECMKKKDFESVIAACTEEINMTEEEPLYKNEAFLLRGTFHQLTGDFTAALSDFDIIINNDKLDSKLRVNALIKRAYVQIQLENPSECLADLNKAVKVDSKNSDIYYHRGQINLMNDQLEEAADDFEIASNLNPNFSVNVGQKCYTDFRCALLLKDEEKLKTIMKRFEQIIKDYPQCSKCYILYAQVLSDQEEYEKSDEIYEKALKMDPQNATLLVFRAILKLKWTGNIDTFITLTNEALELDDKCVLAYEVLGVIELQRGNFKRGIELLDKAINLVKSERDMLHFFTLKNAAEVQKKVLERMNLQLP